MVNDHDLTPLRADDEFTTFEVAADLARSLSAARSALRETAHAAGRARRRARELGRWSRSLPRLTLRMDNDAAGRDFYEAIVAWHSRLMRGRAIAVLCLPDTFETYLRGRHRQAVRTNRRRGLNLGLLARRAESVYEARRLCERLVRHEVLYATRHQLLQRIEHGVMDIWFVQDAHGDCLAAASVTVTGAIARIDMLQVALDIDDRSAAQYVLSTELFRALISAGVTIVITDSMLQSSPGVVYLERRLGFEPMNVRMRLRSSRSDANPAEYSIRR